MTPLALSWKRSATPSGRSWWQLLQSGRRTRESGRGSSPDYPTLLVGDATGGRTSKGSKRPNEAGLRLVAQQEEENWTTLCSGDSQGSAGGGMNRSLRTDVREENWPTMKSSPSGPDFARLNREGSGGDDLITAVVKEQLTLDLGQDWPTLRASEWKGCGPVGSKSQKYRLDRCYLDATVAQEEATGDLYPTLDVGAAKGRGEASADNRSRLGGSLSADWCEVFMGYPAGWTIVSRPSAKPRKPKASPPD